MGIPYKRAYAMSSYALTWVALSMEQGEKQGRNRGMEQLYGGFYFVCDHGQHRNAKRYNFGRNFSHPPCLSQKLHPKSYRLAKRTHYIVSLHEQSRNPHIEQLWRVVTPLLVESPIPGLAQSPCKLHNKTSRLRPLQL